MALISTTTTGGFSDVGSTYVGGVVPVEGDKLTIAAGPVSPLARTHIWSNDPAPLAAAGNSKAKD